MSERTLPRPPQVTFSGWVILVGSLVVLSAVYDTVANLRSIDTREQVEKMLSEPPLSGTGMGLQDLLDLMHGVALVAGGCAAAMVILGAFVLKRDKVARIVVTVLAVPLFLSGLLVGGFATSLVAVSAVLLWTRPARDWFAGRASEPAAPADRTKQWPERPVPRPDDSAPRHSLPAPTVAPDEPRADGPRAWSGYGAAHVATPPAGVRRPRELISACIMTWLFCGLTLASTLTVLAVVPGDDSVLRDLYDDDARFDESGVSFAAMKTTVLVLSAGLALWAVLAMVAALLAYLRHNWARWVLFGSALATAGFSLLLAVGAPMMLVLTGVAIYAAILLTRPAVTEWYRAKGERGTAAR